MKQCPGLLLFCSDMDRINQHLSPDECWQVIYALRQLLEEMDVDVQAMSPLAQFAFSQMSEKVLRDREKYEQICERNRKNARKSHAKPVEATGTQMLPTINVTEKEMENETETVSEKGYVNVADGRGAGTHPQKADGFSSSLETGSRNAFTPPDDNEVAAYVVELGKQMDVRKFMDYNRSRGWQVGSVPMRDWRAAVRNWIARDEESRASPRMVNAQRYHQREYTEEDLSFNDLALLKEAEMMQYRGS